MTPDFWAALAAHQGTGRVHFGQDLKSAAARIFGPVYLATPYSRRALIDGRFDWDAADRAAAQAGWQVIALARRGITALAPVVLAHAGCRAVAGDTPAAADQMARLAADGPFWAVWCAPLLDACKFVWVPQIDGWRESAGIRAEIVSALEAGKIVLIEGVA